MPGQACTAESRDKMARAEVEIIDVTPGKAAESSNQRVTHELPCGARRSRRLKSADTLSDS